MPVRRYAPKSYKTARKALRRKPYNTTRRILRGRGAYTKGRTSVKGTAFGKAIGRWLGGTAGNLTGIPGVGTAGANIGARAGGWLGNKIGTLLGVGAYHVRKNTLSEGEKPAAMHNSGVETRVSHQEFIAKVYYTQSANTTQSEVFFMNPGDSVTFPWLHRLAQNYQEYRMEGAAYKFVSLCQSLYNPNVMTTGQVIIATDYNVAHPTYQSAPFANTVEAQNTQYTTVGKPQESLWHPVECDPSLQPVASQWIRTSSVLPPNVDPRLYDMCKTQVMVNLPIDGSTTPVLIGELWLSFDVTLRKPVFQANSDVHSAIFAGPVATWTGATFGTAATRYVCAGSELGLAISGTQNDTLVFRNLRGRFLIYATWQFLDTNPTATVVLTPVGCNLLQGWAQGPNATHAFLANTLNAMFECVVDITDDFALLRVDIQDVNEGLSGPFQLIVTALDSDMNPGQFIPYSQYHPG